MPVDSGGHGSRELCLVETYKEMERRRVIMDREEMRQVVNAVGKSSTRMGISYLDYADNFKLFFQHACLLLSACRRKRNKGTTNTDYEVLEVVAKLRHMDDWTPAYVGEPHFFDSYGSFYYPKGGE